MIRTREYTHNGTVVARFIETTGFDLTAKRNRNVLKIVGGYTLILKTSADAKKHLPVGACAGKWNIEKA